ncbi:TnsA-like heteromeric transposase endonuclease subunit [Saccharopolyspora hattusasensis]|uniref:TnsA-like heteromeric transposase endonuclease subunit n=1 Tax=Saccharopolyspora hattusasensis TaxID=1128679 RepID=UPI003D9790A1
MRLWSDVDDDALRTAVPWRTFRWYRGQRHYSGTYWSATEKNHVVYESRLELARLLLADFDTSVRGIVAQPILLKSMVSGRERKHVPDFLLFTDDVPVVVDVKPRHRAARPENVFTFDWTRRLVESKGWSYQVFSEPPLAELENVRYLAKYRRDWLFDLGLLTPGLRQRESDPRNEVRGSSATRARLRLRQRVRKTSCGPCFWLTD